MEQYEKGGPALDPKSKEQIDLSGAVARLEKQVATQDRIIRELQSALRRLKDKMDQHAEYLNRQQRG